MTRDAGERDREDEDPMLQSMRSVWLSMREEEPSSKGLDVLLAAARSKAVELKPAPSWWQSLFATLRRPPVLALATVVVLVSGAALINARRADVEVTPKIERPEPKPPAPSQPTGAAGAEEMRDPRKDATDLAKAPAAGSAIAERPQVPRKEAEKAPEPPTRVPSVATGQGSVAPPVVVPKAPDTQANAPTKDGSGEDQHQKPPTVPGVVITNEPATVKVDATTTTDKKKPTVVDGKQERLEIADDDGAGLAARPAGTELKQMASPTVKSSTRSKPREPSSEQLIQQTETAAARGDCSAVRVMADRIKKTDVTAYKARVEKNATIALCLAK